MTTVKGRMIPNASFPSKSNVPSVFLKWEICNRSHSNCPLSLTIILIFWLILSQNPKTMPTASPLIVVTRKPESPRSANVYKTVAKHLVKPRIPHQVCHPPYTMHKFPQPYRTCDLKVFLNDRYCTTDFKYLYLRSSSAILVWLIGSQISIQIPLFLTDIFNFHHEVLLRRMPSCNRRAFIPFNRWITVGP